jgi:glucosamine-6-phosphate deaminase
MEVIIQPNKEAAAKLVAKIVAQNLRAKPDMVLGLATGRTMEAVYALLAQMHRDEKLDFSRTKSFNLDEYVGLAATDPNSYRFYMNEHLFSKVNIHLANTFLPSGVAKDLDAECALYEENIRKLGGIDLQLLGIGRTGHIGFNEPLSPLQSRTRVTPLAPGTIEQNSGLFERPEQMPRRAMTMGVGTILEARQCILLATGAEKAEILAKAIEGPVTSMISASALQFHQQCVVVVDEAAAAKLQNAEFYRFVFANEPKWKDFH